MPGVPLPSPASSSRWTMCALLFFATTLNYMDRQILSLLKPVLDGKLHWTNEQFGWVNASFQGAYGIGLMFFGWFIDRGGTRAGYALAITLWSGAALLHGFAATIPAFILARIALGFGEGGNFPAAMTTVAQWFPAQERAFATGLFNSGSSVGAVLSPVLIPWIALAWGWEAAFISAGLAGFVWLIFWLRLYRPVETPHGNNSNASVERPLNWLQLLRYRQTWSFLTAKLILDPVVWFFLIWLPDYFNQTRGLDLRKSWVHLASIYAIMAVVGVAGSWISGGLVSRGWTVTRARKRVMLGAALAMLPILAVNQVGNWGAVILIGFCCAAISVYVANLFSSVADMFPTSSVASVMGLGGLAGCASGMIFPVICGRLLDAFKAAGNIGGGYAVLFSLCAFGGIAALAIGHALAPTYTPINVST